MHSLPSSVGEIAHWTAGGCCCHTNLYSLIKNTIRSPATHFLPRPHHARSNDTRARLAESVNSDGRMERGTVL